MTDDHGRYRDWAAAYVLGALDRDDRREFDQHLATCDGCSAEVNAVAPLPGLIARIEPAELDETADTTRADALRARARHELQQLLTSRRRWRLVSIAGAAAVPLIVVALVRSTGSDPGQPTANPAVITESMADAAIVTTSPRGWGTEIALELTGLPHRDAYQLWAVDADGGWSIAAAWGPTPAGATKVTGATATASGELDRIVVTSDDRTDVLVDAAP